MHDAHFHYFVDRPGGHHLDVHSRPDGPFFYPQVNDDAPVGVVLAVEDQRLKRRGPVAGGRGNIRDDPLQNIVNVEPVFGGNLRRIFRRNADDVLNLRLDLGGPGGRQVNLVDHRQDLQSADILRGASIGADAFTLSVYPASTPIYMELARNGVLADLLETGAVVKTAFCGPCFGAGDTPANNAFSIRHTTRNFPNREGSKVQNGQISSVALMDARSIAATAANKGFLTSAEEFTGNYRHQKYFFDKTIYENRIFDSKGVADPSVEIQFGPNIKDWPEMPALAENLVLKVVSEIHDPVTTTDELIPSGETSSFRSNPLGLAEFTLSRKDPAYVGRAKEIQKAEKALEAGECPAEAVPELKNGYGCDQGTFF